jgi:hypothetical protein
VANIVKIGDIMADAPPENVVAVFDATLAARESP